MAQKTDFGGNDSPILALKVSKEVYTNNLLLRNRGALKISLLQRYEALWIHDIDAICRRRVVYSRGIPKIYTCCFDKPYSSLLTIKTVLMNYIVKPKLQNDANITKTSFIHFFNRFLIRLKVTVWFIGFKHFQ